MSYYRRVAEVMVFYNDNEKTKRKEEERNVS